VVVAGKGRRLKHFTSKLPLLHRASSMNIDKLRTDMSRRKLLRVQVQEREDTPSRHVTAVTFLCNNLLPCKGTREVIFPCRRFPTSDIDLGSMEVRICIVLSAPSDYILSTSYSARKGNLVFLQVVTVFPLQMSTLVAWRCVSIWSSLHRLIIYHPHSPAGQRLARGPLHIHKP
jgi:hypothetical protein